MSKKKEMEAFKEGMVAGAQPFEEKFNQHAKFLNNIQRSIKHKSDCIQNDVDSLIDIAQEHDDRLNQIQYPELYDISKLEEEEKDVIFSFLIEIVEEYGMNDYQKQMIELLAKYFEKDLDSIDAEPDDIEAAILKLAAANVPVLGICGGYQMLGESIEDPGGEEEGGSLHGMGLLPVRTVFEKEKVQTRVTGEILQNPGAGDGLFAALCGSVFSGYEIHMGHTTGNGKNSFSRIRTLTNGSTEAEEDWQADGAVCGNVAGTYVHGLFEDGSLTKNLCGALLSKKGICAEALTQDYAAFKESQYDLLAAEVRKALDMEQIYRMMEKQEGDR